MDIILRTALVYIAILLTLRMTTRKIMRTSTPLDMAVIFLFGGMGVQAALSGDQSLTGAGLAVMTIAGTHMIISFAKIHWPLVGRISEGTPVVLFSNGRWDEQKMRRLHIQRQDIMAEMRQNGHRSLDEVETATIEHNGALTFIPKPKSK